MLQIEEAIQKLEKIADRHICSSRRGRLQEIIFLLKEELEVARNLATSICPSKSY
jgi:hypothetical protein